MRSLLVILSIAATACTLFGASPLDEKAKAKAKAKAAMNIEAERERDAKSVQATIPAKPFTDLDKAKSAALETGKPLVLWVGEPAEDAMKAVDAVHVMVKEFSPLPDAKCVIFICEKGGCERKSSVSSKPTVQLLRTMLEDVMKTTTKKIGEPEFFIGTNGEPVPAEVEPVAAQSPVVQYRQVCTIDEFGRKTCRLVPIESQPVSSQVPVTITKSFGAGDCPCTANGGTCPCAATGAAGSFQSDRPFQGLRTWFQNRPRLFNGRFVAAFAALRGR